MAAINKIAMVFLAVLNLLKELVAVDLSAVSFGAALVVLISGIALMGKGFKKVTVVFLAVGIALLLYFNQPLGVWISGVNYLTNVISILVIMQLFSIPIEVGKYSEAARYWLTKSFNREAGLFLFATSLTHVFASFLLFGTIPVMVSLLGQTLKSSVTNYERFMAAAVARGYSLVVLWAPGAINLLLVVQATGVSWVELFIPGLILSIIGIFTSWLMEAKLVLSTNPIPANLEVAQTENNATACRKACHIILVVISLVVITVGLGKINIGTGSSRIMLAGLVVVFVWLAAFIKRPEFKGTLQNYWRSGLLKAGDLAPLFIAMGLLSTAVEKSGLLIIIQPGLQSIANSLGVFSMAILPLLMILCAIAGIHPFISIVLCGRILTALNLPIAPVTLGLCLGLGGSISYIASPFAGIVLTLAKFINCRTVDIALRWNLTFGIVFFIEGIIFAYLWGCTFG